MKDLIIDSVDAFLDVAVDFIDTSIHIAVSAWRSFGRQLSFISLAGAVVLISVWAGGGIHNAQFKDHGSSSLASEPAVSRVTTDPSATPAPALAVKDAKLTGDDVWWIVTRAYMEALTIAEGTNSKISGGDPYKVQVGGAIVGGESFGWKHPRQLVGSSDAYGFAQFLSSTIDDLHRRYTGPNDWDYDLPEMHPNNQDRAYFWITHETGSLKALHEGVNFDPKNNHISVSYSAWKKAVSLDNGRWPSLPGGIQQHYTEHEQYTSFVWALWGQAGYYRKIIDPLTLAAAGNRRISDRHSFRHDRPGGRWHKGYDFATPIGTPVVAPESGTILYTEYQEGGAGNYIGLSPDGYPEQTIKFFHLSRYPVKAGQKVKAGETIAFTGESGVGTGPHLHMEVWVGADHGDEGWIDVGRYLGMAQWFKK